MHRTFAAFRVLPNVLLTKGMPRTVGLACGAPKHRLGIILSRQASVPFSRYSLAQLAVLESHCGRAQPTLRTRQILLWSADPSQASVAFSRYSLTQLGVLESHCREIQPTLRARKILQIVIIQIITVPSPLTQNHPVTCPYTQAKHRFCVLQTRRHPLTH